MCKWRFRLGSCGKQWPCLIARSKVIDRLKTNLAARCKGRIRALLHCNIFRSGAIKITTILIAYYCYTHCVKAKFSC